MIFNTIVAGSGGIKLDSIAVTTPPTKTSYLSGESFDPTGMVVTATYTNGAKLATTGYTVEPSGPLPGGITSVTIRYTEGGVTKTVTLTVTVESLPAVGTVLNDISWADIKRISDAGLASNYFAVGDTKAVTLSGKASKLSLNGTYYVYILGFNHNGAANTIDFGTFKTALSGGIDIALISGYDDSSDFQMNTTGTNSGGWKDSDMRYTILGSSDTKNGNATASTATNPVENTLLSTFPADLRAVMKPMTVYTDNIGGGNDTASNVTSTVDYLPLLAEFEVFGTRTYANSAEQNYQKQYDYYSAVNSKVKYHHSETGSPVVWWERSPCYGNSDGFCFVYSNGVAYITDANWTCGVAPVFRV